MLRLATRKSKLALWQAEFVKQQLLRVQPDLAITIVGMSSEGDEIHNKPLAEFGGKGLFIKRLEEALLNDEADFAVHSMKDVPPSLTAAFCLPAILERAPAQDVLVSLQYQTLTDLPKGAVVGTSSVRRSAQIKNYRKDLNTKVIRGNVDTRLKKLLAGEYDALILAQAGLQRLGLEAYIKEIIPLEICLPSVGQGAIGIECLSKNKELQKLLNKVSHAQTEACVIAERSFTHHLGANCTSPVGSFAQVHEQTLHLQAQVLNLDGTAILKDTIEGNIKEASKLGEQLAQTLIAQGARKLF